MPDRRPADHFRDEAERLVALADSCPFVRHKRPLFEFAVQYHAAARRLDERLRPKSRSDD